MARRPACRRHHHGLDLGSESGRVKAPAADASSRNCRYIACQIIIRGRLRQPLTTSRARSTTPFSRSWPNSAYRRAELSSLGAPADRRSGEPGRWAAPSRRSTPYPSRRPVRTPSVRTVASDSPVTGLVVNLRSSLFRLAPIVTQCSRAHVPRLGPVCPAGGRIVCSARPAARDADLQVLEPSHRARRHLNLQVDRVGRRSRPPACATPRLRPIPRERTSRAHETGAARSRRRDAGSNTRDCDRPASLKPIECQQPRPVALAATDKVRDRLDRAAERPPSAAPDHAKTRGRFPPTGLTSRCRLKKPHRPALPRTGGAGTEKRPL